MPRIAFVACLLLHAVPASPEEAFAPLFHGTDLSVWINSGGSHEVVDAELRARGGRGSII